MAQTAKNNVDDLHGDVNSQIAILRDDIAKLTATIAEYGKAQGLVMKAAAAKKAEETAAEASETLDRFKAKAEQTYADTEEAVRSNPAAAVSIAAGLGFLIGLLTSRR